MRMRHLLWYLIYEICQIDVLLNVLSFQKMTWETTIHQRSRIRGDWKHTGVRQTRPTTSKPRTQRHVGGEEERRKKRKDNRGMTNVAQGQKEEKNLYTNFKDNEEVVVR